jgi:tetratricopeptide (TPR) repeat protein
MMTTDPTLQQALDAALVHHRAGRLHDAEAIYRQILTADPRHADALHLLGVIASQVGRQDVAVDLIGQAIAVDGRQADYFANFGVALAELGRLDEATVAYQRAISLNPRAAGAFNNLGNAFQRKGVINAAVSCFQQAITLKADFADPHYNLGNISLAAGRLEKAVAHYRQALALRPDWPVVFNNLGNALCALGEFDIATDTARQALALHPADPLAHWNFGLMLLRTGDLPRGLAEYEWRWQTKELGLSRAPFRQPQWDGSDLNGRRILLYSEQGFGDTLQFIRYLPMVKARGGQIIVACQPELLGLLQQIDGVEQRVAAGQPAPEFDVHCPLASLPAALNTELATIPADVPYLHADNDRTSRWRERLASLHGLKVGLAWAGRASHPHDLRRSMSLEKLAPLAQVPGVTLISLQKGVASSQAQTARTAGVNLIDWTDELKDFSDTAALIANLDLIITVDTAVAHLGGAMGKPVWVLLPIVPDWRWMLHREDSPWYPTLRLFRQAKYEDWSAPVTRVTEELGKLSADHDRATQSAKP